MIQSGDSAPPVNFFSTVGAPSLGGQYSTAQQSTGPTSAYSNSSEEQQPAAHSSSCLEINSILVPELTTTTAPTCLTGRETDSEGEVRESWGDQKKSEIPD
jgi:hypothetical protein